MIACSQQPARALAGPLTSLRKRLWLIAATFGFLQAFPSIAPCATLSDPARSEITHLLSYVETSGCEFFRNGSWGSGRAAREHLTMKYDYLLKRGQVRSADDFIAKAATASSMSGSDYQVRCAERPAMTSARWLRAELARLRGTEAKLSK